MAEQLPRDGDLTPGEIERALRDASARLRDPYRPSSTVEWLLRLDARVTALEAGRRFATALLTIILLLEFARIAGWL